jgi:uncharacterized protein (UPF0335 family)
MINNQIKAIVERIEQMEEEKLVIATDISEIYREAKSNGFDTKIIKKIVAMRKKDPNKLAEEQAIMDTYMAALGMLADTPLGQAAIDSARGRE